MTMKITWNRLARVGAGVLLAGVLGSGLSACGGGGSGGGSTAPDSAQSSADKQQLLANRIDSVLESEQAANAPGISILVVKDGQIIYSRSKGMARSGVPIGDHTAFEIASLSKPITATAIMQLREHGIVSLDDSILKWIPELPAAWRPIQIRHLLEHQSGIPDFLIGLPISQAYTLDGFTDASLIRRFAGDATLHFTPGSNGEYANSNYVLLAEVIARASGTTYPRYVREHILQPAGMTSTFVFDEPVPPATDVALDYGTTDKTFGFKLATYGATGIYSTTNDIRLLASSLLNGKLLSMDSLSLMTQTQTPSLLAGGTYGYGFFVFPGTQPLSTFYHRGDLDGFYSLLRVNKTKGMTTIALGNGGKTTDHMIDEVLTIVQTLFES